MQKRTLLTLKLAPFALAVSQAAATDYNSNGGNSVTGGTWSPDATPIISGSTITPLAGDRLYMNGGNFDSGTISVGPGAELRATGGGQRIVSSHIELGGTGVDGSGAWQNTGGDWFRPSSVTITSNTTFNNASGGWRQQGDNGTSSVGNNLFQLNGNTLTVNGTSNFYFIGTAITGGGTIVVNNNNGADFNWEASGQLPEDVELILNNSRSSSWDGAGVQMLGNITLNNSILENRANDAGKSYNGTITIPASSTGTLRVSQAVGTNNFMVVNGQITGGGKLIRDGNTGERVILNAPNNNYSGGTDLQQGTTVLGANNALSTGPVDIKAPATLDLAGFSQTINGGTISGNVVSTGGGGALSVNGVTITTNLNNIGGMLEVTGNSTYAPTFSSVTVSAKGLAEWARDNGPPNDAGQFFNGDFGTQGATFTGIKDGPVGIDAPDAGHETWSWIYTGEILNTTGTDIGVTFAEQYDDNIKIKIDGNVVLNDGGWNTATASSVVNLTPGAHTVEFSSYEGGGGEGPNSGWTKGIGIKVGPHTITDPNGGGDNGAFLQVNSANLQTIGLDFGIFTNTIVTGANSDSKNLSIASGASLTVNTTGVTGGDYTMNGAISGGGGLTKAGAGKLVLAGMSTYSGRTLVTGGTLALTSGKTLASSSDIVIQDGATFDASQSPMPGGFYIIPAAQTLSGNGTAEGKFQVVGTLAPGESIGSLEVAGDIRLRGVSEFEVSRAAGVLTSDLLSVSGNLNLGGTLIVTSIGERLAMGDTFNLFDWGTRVGNFSGLDLPVWTDDDYWETSNLLIDGTITYVPEAGSTGLALLGAALLMRRRRK